MKVGGIRWGVCGFREVRPWGTIAWRRYPTSTSENRVDFLPAPRRDGE